MVDQFKIEFDYLINNYYRIRINLTNEEKDAELIKLTNVIFNKTPELYKPVSFYPRDFFENELTTMKKKFNLVEKSKLKSKGIVYLSELEQERLLNLNFDNILDVFWCHNSCEITYNNSVKMYRIVSEKTSLIQNYFLFFKSHNHVMSNWHKRLIRSSISDDVYANEDFINKELYTMYADVLKLLGIDIYCANAYYYKVKSKANFNVFRIDISKSKPLSLQLQCAHYVIHNIEKFDLKILMLKGLRSVYRRMHFKVNNWFNLTMEEILLHKLFFYQLNCSIQENVIFRARPFCKCLHTLTNNKCLKHGKCVLCMSLQLQRRRYEMIAEPRYWEDHKRHLYCFC